jgi:hypothetical protein
MLSGVKTSLIQILVCRAIFFLSGNKYTFLLRMQSKHKIPPIYHYMTKVCVATSSFKNDDLCAFQC